MLKRVIVLTWVKPIEDGLTTKYYRQKALDKTLNTIRDLSTYIEGLWYDYDYKDGDIVIKGIHHINKDYFGGLYKGIRKTFDIENNNHIRNIIEKDLSKKWEKDIKINKIKCK